MAAPAGSVPAISAPARAADIRDVAAAAGVSTATVSRALRGVPRVAAATRQRVLEAASGLGYVPSTAASELGRARGARWSPPAGQAPARTGTILVLTDPDAAAQAGGLASASQTIAAGHGISVRCVAAADGAAAAGILQGVDPSVLGVVIGAGNKVHSSVLLQAAVAVAPFPVVEVVPGNPHRQGYASPLSAMCTAVIAGAGDHGFKLAIDYLAATARRRGT